MTPRHCHRAGVAIAAAVALATCTDAAGRQSGTQGAQRARMVDEQIEARGITNARVLEAMRKVPRHRFVPEPLIPQAYEDRPLPIGYGQTISQPFIVAYMTDMLRLSANDTVLEIGTGSGYQAAILGELVKEVYTIEIVEALAMQSTRLLADLGYRNVHVRHGNGYLGWPEAAPFDKIIVTAAPDHVPPALVDQLKAGGQMVLPVGPMGQDEQVMTVVRKTDRGVTTERTLPVRFVPMVGRD